MKKFTILALAALLVVAFTIPAWATEHEITGSWRARFYSQKRFDGTRDGNTQEVSRVDQRTRVEWTANINDNLKLVHRFEYGDVVWGNGFAVPGTDGIAIEVVWSYIDFNLTPQWNWKVGLMPYTLNHGHMIAAEPYASVQTTYTVRPGLAFTAFWVKVSETVSNWPLAGQDATPIPTDFDGTINDMDIDVYGVLGKIALSKSIMLTPSYYFMHSQFGRAWGGVGQNAAAIAYDNINIHWLGLDLDGKVGNLTFAFTGLMQFGNVSLTESGQAWALASQQGNPDDDNYFSEQEDITVYGWMAWMMMSYNFGMFDLHMEAMYSTGEDWDGLADGNWGAFITLPRNATYWSEIMGMGTFDNNTTPQTAAATTTNLWYVGFGTNITPMEKMRVSLDFWYAELVHDRVWQDSDGDWNHADELGFEVDLKVRYEIVEGLNLDLVAAYLFRDDGTYKQESRPGGKNQAGYMANFNPVATPWNDNWSEGDPWEIGAMLSLSF